MTAPGRPVLVVVTGPPASGKTTIAREIGRVLALPAFHKDEFKECLADEIQGNGLAWSQNLGRVSYLLLYRAASSVLTAGQNCLVEANFHPDLSLPDLTAITRASDIIQVLCAGDPEMLLQRYLDRNASGSRHPIHLDSDARRLAVLRTTFRRDHRLALDGPVLDCDTTRAEPVDVSLLVSRILNEYPHLHP